MSNNVENFKTELYELLKKYNAILHFDCDECSDLHGVYGEKMTVEIKGVDHTLNHGMELDAHDVLKSIKE